MNVLLSTTIMIVVIIIILDAMVSVLLVAALSVLTTLTFLTKNMLLSIRAPRIQEVLKAKGKKPKSDS